VASSRAAAAAELAARAAQAEEKNQKKADKAEARARKDAERAARESTKLRKLGIGKAALSASEASLMTDKEARRVETKRKRGAVAGREKDVLAKLDRFKSGLFAGASAAKRASESELESDPANADHLSDGGREGAVGVSRFVSEGLYYAEEGDDDDDAADWKSHALRFADDTRRDPSAYAASADDYVVEDPLLEKGKGKFAKTDREKKRGNAWAGGSLT
jgi:peptidyl-prolyl cis-trans isomerase SDCCAG10